MLKKYDNSVEQLKMEIGSLGMAVENAIDKTWKALESFDTALASEIYRGDDDIDKKVKECMRMDLNISMLQSPAASDWRSLMATLKILSDLERIADHCADICHYVMILKETGRPIAPPPGLKEMYGVMSSMVSDVLDFYQGSESSQAAFMKDKDDIVDIAFNTILGEIGSQMSKDPDNARQYIDYVLIVKYVERMADHANNIAEWIIYREKNEINI
ncbi:phosphate signaling complex protein PhoU [uncultured Megasphaera sp.]|uniref:phosphate signaling complex protein PhoU n=1 Tax=uncultured Megasphaera sp. TaxID=165188 RepID=UPI002657D08D|nr:phosphate signaling complex protein PhoU [uncultured Megasphaera sp.]